ncbi:MAG: hypothetical protein OEZ06_27865 [Myxococcales bacterium]|nr:hypothetical protein [Myxococcales bacterium]
MLERLPFDPGDARLWGVAFALSVITLAAGLFLIPVVLIGLEPDHFVHERGLPRPPRRHPLVHALLVFSRNALGLFLLVLGVAMLVLPGQGLLTIIAALTLITLPGKRRLARYLLSRRSLHRLVDRLRARAGRPPLQL